MFNNWGGFVRISARVRLFGGVGRFSLRLEYA